MGYSTFFSSRTTKKAQSYKVRVLLQGGYDIREITNCRDAFYVTDVASDRSNLKSDKGARVPGTFEWITSNEMYKAWLSADSHTLHITAGPGRGKTMLALFILENIENHLGRVDSREANVSVGRMKGAEVYYFFCTSGDGNRRDSVKVLRSLIYQIIKRHEDLIQHILDFIQPLVSGSHHLHETNRPTDVEKQPSDEYEQKGASASKGQNQRSRSIDNPDSMPSRLPFKSGLVNKFLGSGAGAEEKVGENVEAREETKTESKERAKSKPKFLQNMLGQGRKEESKMEPDKQAEIKPDTPVADVQGPTDKEFSTNRQLELLGARELTYILEKLIQEMDVDVAYFLLDGVDECGKEEQEALTDKLLKLCDIAPGKFRLLVVSRPITGLGKAPLINIGEIKSDIQKFVAHSVGKLSNVDGFDEQIRGEVEQTLLSGAEGTFLWVSLVMAELEKKRTCTEILDTIKTVPKGLDAKYGHMLRQIDKYHQNNVFQMLRWVTTAFRPMNLQEMSVVIAKPPDPRLTPEQAVRDAVIGSEGLLEVRGDQVMFVHTSAKVSLSGINSEVFQKIFLAR